MKMQRIGLGLLALAIAFTAAGCGQAQDAQATLHITSVPQGDIYVDGEHRGTSGDAVALSAGEHKIEVKHDRFVTYQDTVTVAAGSETVREITLEPQDPSDPVVIAALAACEGVDVAPFVAPETHRGSRDKRSVAVLLWPARDVRSNGLVNFAIEADETYEGDATLEFRKGRTVLYREAFKPESITTIRPLPAEVREKVKVGAEITWGLYFEDSRRPIKTSFKVVKRPKADRQLARLAESRHMKRQPKITQEIMAATVLENNRLYTEALVASLEIAANHPSSLQPYRGIVTTLRRLDAENSELFAFVSPHVSGKGGRSGFARPTATAGGDLGIAAWAPTRAGATGMPTADAGTSPAGTMRPGGQGVTPQGGTSDTPSEPGVTAPDSPTADGGVQVPGQQTGEQPGETRDPASKLSARLEDLDGKYDAAKESADEAASARDEATAKAQAAEEAAAAARAAVEGADEPTEAQLEAMAATGRAAETAREAAEAATKTHESANATLAEIERQRAETSEQLAALKQGSGDGAGRDGAETPRTPATDEGSLALERAKTEVESAQATLDEAKAALDAAEKAYAADPSDRNKHALDEASSAADAAAKSLRSSDEALRAMQERVERMGKKTQTAKEGN